MKNYKTHKKILLIFAGFLLNMFTSISFATDHSGTCSGVFLAINNPHILTGTCTVPVGQTLTLETGVQLDTPSGSRTLVVNGDLNADNVTIDNINVNYRAGSGGTLQNSTLTHTAPITLSGTSLVTPAAPSFIQNTINATTGIDIQGTAIPTITGNTIINTSKGLWYRGTAGGSASGNTLDFVPGLGNIRIAIDVDGAASPNLDSNIIMDDPFKDDTLIDLSGISLASTVAVTNNQVCVTGNDLAYRVNYNFFANNSNIAFFGNTPTCDAVLNVPVSAIGGSIGTDITLTAVNGVSTLNLAAETLLNGSTMVISSGLTVSSGSTTNFTLLINGNLNADNVTFDKILLSYRDGSGGLLQNSVMFGTTPIYLTGTSITGPASPTISGNTITATSNGIWLQGTAAPSITGNTITTNFRGIRYEVNSRGTASGNTIGFTIGGASSRLGIIVTAGASPVLDGNIFNDDPNRNDTAIDISGITAASVVTVTNNTICKTAGDVALNLGFAFFDINSTSTITGTTLTCDPIISIPVLTGSFQTEAIMTPVDGVSSFLFTTITISNGGTMTIPAGITISSNSTVDRAINISGTLNADQVTFDRIRLNYRDGSDGLLQASTINAASPIILSGSSITDAATPMISGNSINAINGTAIDIQGTAAPTIMTNTITTNSKGLWYRGSVGGTASGNTISFVIGGSSSRIAVDVDATASPIVDGNNLLDDPNRNDTAVDISGITVASTVKITNNTICTTGGDIPFNLGFGYFGLGVTADVSGNTLICDPATSIPLNTGTGGHTLVPVNGISRFTTLGITVGVGGSFTVSPGITLASNIASARSITVDGTFNANGVIFENLFFNFRAGSSGTLQNSSFMSLVNGNGFLVADATINLMGNTFQNFFSAWTLNGSSNVTADSNTFINNSNVFNINSPSVIVTPTNNLYDSNTFSYVLNSPDSLFSAMPSLLNGEQFIGLATQNRISIPSVYNNVSGTIRTAPIPYRFNGNASIGLGSNMIIEPGVVFQFDNFRNMTISVSIERYNGQETYAAYLVLKEV